MRHSMNAIQGLRTGMVRAACSLVLGAAPRVPGAPPCPAAGTYYVSTTGSDSTGSGSLAQALENDPEGRRLGRAGLDRPDPARHLPGRRRDLDRRHSPPARSSFAATVRA